MFAQVLDAGPRNAGTAPEFVRSQSALSDHHVDMFWAAAKQAGSFFNAQIRFGHDLTPVGLDMAEM